MYEVAPDFVKLKQDSFTELSAFLEGREDKSARLEASEVDNHIHEVARWPLYV